MAPSSRERQERKIDQALEETFPASDTPSFVGAGATPDKPPREERRDHRESEPPARNRPR
ncbi:MAG: hypothetical protein K2Y27_11900 [Xanthobacteraceae bacterium]|nr:hypothetical protein [Xanthobacteraceae bacterium]